MHRTSTAPGDTARWEPTSSGSQPGRSFMIAVTWLAGVFMVAAGAWALLGPGSFADATGFARQRARTASITVFSGPG